MAREQAARKLLAAGASKQAVMAALTDTSIRGATSPPRDIVQRNTLVAQVRFFSNGVDEEWGG